MEKTKQHLLAQLQQCKSMPFLFVGSGLSRRYLKTEGWEDLLALFAKYANPGNEFAYKLYKDPYRDHSDKLDYLPKIASTIEADFNKVWYSNPEWEESREKNALLIEQDISPFKIAIAEHFATKEIDLSLLGEMEKQELNLLRSIYTQSIFGVITTNYDFLFEKLFPDFKVFVGQEELIFSSPQYIREIYKVHGCCSTPSSIIINQYDYDTFLKNKAYLAAKLLTIFVEHPIVFIGYSLNDPNIEQIIKSIIDCLSQKNLSTLKDRFIFIERNNLSETPQISLFEKTFEGKKTISMTKISTKSFVPIFKAIAENKAKYPTNILRHLKEDVYNLVRTNTAKANLYVKDLESLQPNDPIEVVLGVGVFAQMGLAGYKTPTDEELYRDIIFDDGNFDNSLMVEHTLPGLLLQHSNSVPIYKYLANYQGQIPEAVSRCITDEFDKFISNTSRKARDSRKKHYTVKAVCESLPEQQQLEQLAWLLPNEIDTTHLLDFLKNLLNTYPDIFKDAKKKSLTRRLIKIYDWLVYHK